MKRWVLAVACLTLVDVKTIECRSYCRYAAGYDGGIFSNRRNKCVCMDEIDNERLEEKRLILPNKPKPRASLGLFVEHLPENVPSEPQIPFKLPWED